MYHLSDVANASIPHDIREQFHRDENDHVLFFTAPPVDVPRVPGGASVQGHSLKYLAKKAKDEEAVAEKPSKKRRMADDEVDPVKKKYLENLEDLADDKVKGWKAAKAKAQEAKEAQEAVQKAHEAAAWDRLGEHLMGTLKVWERMYGRKEALRIMNEDLDRLALVQAEERKKNEERAKREQEMKERDKIKIWGYGL